MVVRTSAVVCGRADGPHRPIELLRFGVLNGSIGPDSGRGATRGWSDLSLRVVGLIGLYRTTTYRVHHKVIHHRLLFCINT
jgi:hypothetical protein